MGKEFFPRGYETPKRFTKLPPFKNNPDKLIFSPETAEPEPILEKYLGDRRFQLTGMSAGILQLMHPVVGKVIAEQSDFFETPWRRILASVPQIMGGFYDVNYEETAKRIRDAHKDLDFVDVKGKRKHALNLDVFLWPHLTFVKMTEDVIENFDRRELSPKEKEHFYQESREWFSRYGMGMRGVPPDYESYKKTLDNMFENVLQLTPAAKEVITKVSDRTIEPRPGLLTVASHLGLRAPLNEVVRLFAIGGLPPVIRERFKMKWSKADELKLKSMQETTKRVWPVVPDLLIYHPRARAGRKAARQQQAA